MEDRCEAKNRNVHTAGILESIPRSDGEAKPLRSLCPGYVDNAACESCMHTLLAFLNVFAAVTIITGGKGSGIRIKAKTQAAIYFLKSLAAYIRNGLTVVSNWGERAGAGESALPSLVLRSGTHLVYQMEYNRVVNLNDQTPIRKEEVSQAIIKARIRGRSRSQPVYLFQYDERSQHFQLVGGRKKFNDQNALETMKREIDEELTPNRLEYKKDYELKELKPDLRNCNLSYTFGAYTEYRFTIYQLFLKRPQLILGPNDRWITLQEIFDGKEKTGIRVSGDYLKELDEQLPGGLKSLPLSMDEVQKRPLREIIKERRWEIAGIIATLLATIIAVLLTV